MTLWRRFGSVLGPRWLTRLMRFYPPFFGAGIRVARADSALREIEVAMTLRWWNRNYVGSHFGGSLYSMCDPFFMLIVMERLGPAYTVWDKSAAIEFLRPGKGTVRALFTVSDRELASIRDAVAREGKAHPRFETVITDETGAPVARVAKVLSVRKRPA